MTGLGLGRVRGVGNVGTVFLFGHHKLRWISQCVSIIGRNAITWNKCHFDYRVNESGEWTDTTFPIFTRTHAHNVHTCVSPNWFSVFDLSQTSIDKLNPDHFRLIGLPQSPHRIQVLIPFLTPQLIVIPFGWVVFVSFFGNWSRSSETWHIPRR